MGFESFEIWSAVKQVKYRETFDQLHTMIVNSHGDVDNAISSVLDVVCNALTQKLVHSGFIVKVVMV